MTSWVPLVSGILVGSISGIGGTAVGAWMNRKSQLAALKLTISSENDRIQYADKRRLYAQFAARVKEYIDAIASYSDPANKSEERISSDKSELKIAAQSTAHVVNEIILVAPNRVGDLANEIYNSLLSYHKSALDGKRNISIPDHKINKLNAEIYREMRKDIGFH